MMRLSSSREDIPSNAILTAFTAARSAIQSVWLLYVDLPLAVVSDILHSGQERSGLASLQTAVGLQRALSDLVQLLVALYLQVLRWVPVVGVLLSTITATLLGPLAPAIRQHNHRQRRHRQPVTAGVRLTGPARVAIVLNELSCSQAQMQALGRLIVWCVCVQQAWSLWYQEHVLRPAHSAAGEDPGHIQEACLQPVSGKS